MALVNNASGVYSTLGYNGEIKTFSPEEVISNLLIKLKHLASNYLKYESKNSE